MTETFIQITNVLTRMRGYATLHWKYMTDIILNPIITVFTCL